MHDAMATWAMRNVMGPCGDPAVINKDTTCCCCWYVRDGDPGGDIAPSAKAMSLLECEERLLRRGVEGESETDRSDSDPSPELTKSGGESCAASEVPGKKGDRDSALLPLESHSQKENTDASASELPIKCEPKLAGHRMN